MLNEIIEMVLSSFIIVYASTFIWRELETSENDKFSISNLNKYIICSLIVTINYIFMHDFIKPITSTIIMMIYCNCLKKIEIKKCIILPIYSQLIIFISEFVFALLLISVFGTSAEKILNTYYGNIISNIVISSFAIYISKIKITSNIYYKIISVTDKLNELHLVIISVILSLIASVLTAFFYYKISLVYLLIFNTLIVVVYTIFIFKYLKTNNNYLKVYDKYNLTLNSLKEYEDILSRYRISNHENKNQLLTIRGMVKNKKVASYIDEIVENKIKDNEKLMFDSLVIPEGGLRGLIYSKMLLMKESNIEFDLCVDKIIKTTDLTSISDDLMLSICNIVGVYLDNAIEAVKELDEKYIMIEIYLDDTLNIAITNNYEGSIDLDKIDNVGYSTKGGNHGYGLSLVKKIIANNRNITSEKRINDDEFTQEIKIKYKK